MDEGLGGARSAGPPTSGAGAPGSHASWGPRHQPGGWAGRAGCEASSLHSHVGPRAGARGLSQQSAHLTRLPETSQDTREGPRHRPRGTQQAHDRTSGQGHGREGAHLASSLGDGEPGGWGGRQRWHRAVNNLRGGENRLPRLHGNPGVRRTPPPLLARGLATRGGGGGERPRDPRGRPGSPQVGNFTGGV